MPSLPGAATNRWLKRRRSYFIMLLYRDFYRVFLQFQAIYLVYIDKAAISYAALDGLIGSESAKGRLWRLKDRCHLLWNNESDRTIEGCLLDLVLGSLFHECMKLKENIYLRERYRPQLEQYLSDSIGAGSDPSWPAAMGMGFKGFEWKRVLLNTDGESGSQMENLNFLFGQANYLFRLLLQTESGNRILLRYLIEHEEMVAEVWHESLDQLFADLYAGHPELAFLSAGRSYQEGHWYDRAHAAFSRALALQPDNHEARQQLPGLAQCSRLQRSLLEETEEK